MQPEHRARLCTLVKWDTYPGYGFSLQATKGKVGHFINEVDENSPAYAGGIRNDDFVVEVNGKNVLTEAHRDVVDRIMENEDKVTLLVLDRESRYFFDSNHIVVDEHMKELERIVCPSRPKTESEPSAPEDRDSVIEIRSNGTSRSFDDDRRCSSIAIRSNGTSKGSDDERSRSASSGAVLNEYATEPKACLQLQREEEVERELQEVLDSANVDTKVDDDHVNVDQQQEQTSNTEKSWPFEPQSCLQPQREEEEYKVEREPQEVLDSANVDTKGDDQQQEQTSNTEKSGPFEPQSCLQPQREEEEYKVEREPQEVLDNANVDTKGDDQQQEQTSNTEKSWPFETDLLKVKLRRHQRKKPTTPTTSFMDRKKLFDGL